MDLNVRVAHFIGFILMAGIAGILMVQCFWLSRHILRDFLPYTKKLFVRVAHAIGLTNLSDKQVEDYLKQ